MGGSHFGVPTNADTSRVIATEPMFMEDDSEDLKLEKPMESLQFCCFVD